ncbi:MAG: hypothetical protein V4620_06325 [Bacteroidota bacterium]
MKDKNIENKTLRNKIKQSTNIDELRILYKEFHLIFDEYTEEHRLLPNRHKYFWDKIGSVSEAILHEFEMGSVPMAKSCMTTNLVALSNGNLNIKNKKVQLRQDICFIKRKRDIKGFYMSAVGEMLDNTSEIHRLLWKHNPIKKTKSNYEYFLKKLDRGNKDILDNLSQFKNAKRPSDSLVSSYSHIKKDIIESIEECLAILENRSADTLIWYS